MSELNVGDEVMMKDKEHHEYCPKKFPAKGNIGVVVQCASGGEVVLVDWGQDSGVDWDISEDKYAWWCTAEKLEKVNANTQKKEGICNMNKFNVGDKIVFTNAEKHELSNKIYPAVGTVGTVKEIYEERLLIDWGDAKGVEISCSRDNTKLWWCAENDVKSYTQENDYTDDEVWEMLKPKMRQLVPAYIENLDMYSPIVKKMVVAAYHSGYGRATKGRSFIIKPKVDEKPSKKSIDDVLGGKTIVTFYKDDNSYNVANFAFSRENGSKTELYADIAYSSAGDSWSFGFDVISDPDCEMYVAIPFSEAIGQFDSDSTKVLFCGDKVKALHYNLKPWVIGEFDEFFLFGDETRASMMFKREDGNVKCYPEIHKPEFKVLIPICDYLKLEGVNV